MREGWSEKTMNEIATITMGQSPSGNSINETEGIEFHQGKIYFGERYIKESQFYTSEPIRIAEPNSLLLCVRAPIGVVNMTDRKICIGRGLCSIQANDSLHSNFLYYALLSQKDHFNKNATGSTFQAISSNVVKETIISFPSKDKQIQISTELDMITELISKYDEQLKELDKLSQSIFYEMFGDPVENEKGWEFKSLSNICDVFAGGDKPSDLSDMQSKEYPYPVIANGDGNKGVLGYSKNCKVKDDSVTIGARGASIGNCRLVRNGFTPAVRLITLVPKRQLNCIYLYYYVKNMDYRVNGVAQAQLTVPNIKGEIIPIPPLPLQQSFARKIEAIEAMKSKVKEAKKEAKTLLAARMQYWFE